MAGFAPPRLPSRREGSGCGDALVRAPGSVVGERIGGDPDKVRGWVEKLQNTRKNKRGGRKRKKEIGEELQILPEISPFGRSL